jgi:hypothetical protein
MAIGTSLRLVAKRISQSVKAYANSQGWAPGDYALAGTFDEKTERISLVFGTDREFDETQCYAGILRELRQAFSDSPSIIRQIGLVVLRVSSLDEVYLQSQIGQDERDLTDLLEHSWVN